MSKHTPGPWRQWEALSGSENHRGFWVGATHGIAHVMPLGSDPTDEGIANARLIAAAPELLEAVNGLLRLIRNAQDELSRAIEPDGDADTALNNLLDLLDGPTQREAERSARAAIAKAEGK